MKKYSAIFFCLFASCISTAQDKDKQLQDIDAALSSQKKSISNVLSDNNYLSLHSLTNFREIIKKYAKAEKVTMVTANEPGKKITVQGIVKTKAGEPISGALIYVYQTSDKGLYADTSAHVNMNSGDMNHARLFAYFKTNEKGIFEFETIQPQGYPNSDLPAHIHIMVWKEGRVIHNLPGELLFDDDERLTSERRKRSLEDGYIIAADSGPVGKPLYAYTLIAGN
ncbi:MAG: hypothetical protein V4685_14525 [Bacteroidota bacterium]